MKKLYLLLICLTLITTYSHAQAPEAGKTIAPYRILTTDSVYVTPANLQKNKPVMLIYFSPDCSHCQHFMYELKPELDKLKDVQIVMVTFVNPLKAIQVFKRDFGLTDYKNITIGTEGYTYTVQRYYHIVNFPYIVIYDKKGNLFKNFDPAPKVPVLMQTIKKV